MISMLKVLATENRFPQAKLLGTFIGLAQGKVYVVDNVMLIIIFECSSIMVSSATLLGQTSCLILGIL